MAEKEEISGIVKRGGKKDRSALWELYGQLEKEDYKAENKAPFLEKIYEKIRKMDEDEIERICPDIASLSFAEGLEAYEKIEQGMFLRLHILFPRFRRSHCSCRSLPFRSFFFLPSRHRNKRRYGHYRY